MTTMSDENGAGLLAGADARRKSLLRVVWFAGGAVLAAFLLDFPYAPSGRFLDAGWALAFGHFLKARQQAGVDYTFTYGPLGFLAVPAFMPGLFWLKYAWAIVFAVVASVVATKLMVRMPSAVLAVCWFWLTLRVLPHSETLYIALLVGAPLLHLLDDDWSPRSLSFTCALLALLGLVKFTFLVFGTATLVVLVAGAPRSERRRVALRISGLFIICLVSLWVIAGQSLLNFPKFISASLQMVRGYTEAMAIVGSTKRLAAAQQTLEYLVFGLLLVPPRAWLDRRRLLGTALLAAGLFLAWKEGFVRQDPPHEAAFFGFAALASLLARTLDPRPRSDEALLRVAFLAIAALTSIGAAKNLSGEETSDFWALTRARQIAAFQMGILASPRDHLRHSQDIWREEQRKWLLPAIRERVGREPIDVTSYDQMTIFWNAFNWRHRPAFQGYAAYTPALARENAEFLTGPSAPRYVLANLATIDERYPPEDDGPFLIELIRRYHPVVSEREYILLERRAPAEVQYVQGGIVEQRTVWFGEPVTLDADVKDLTTLSVHIRRTLAGKVRQFLFRLPKVSVLVELADGSSRRYALVPGLSEAEFIINPFIEANVDLYPVYGGVGRNVRSFTLTTDAEGLKSFGDAFDMTLRCYGQTSRCRD